MVGDLYINSISRQHRQASKKKPRRFLSSSFRRENASSWRKTTTMQEAAGDPQELERYKEFKGNLLVFGLALSLIAGSLLCIFLTTGLSLRSGEPRSPSGRVRPSCSSP
jgi:hypothetical protein